MGADSSLESGRKVAISEWIAWTLLVLAGSFVILVFWFFMAAAYGSRGSTQNSEFMFFNYYFLLTPVILIVVSAKALIDGRSGASLAVAMLLAPAVLGLYYFLSKFGLI